MSFWKVIVYGALSILNVMTNHLKILAAQFLIAFYHQQVIVVLPHLIFSNKLHLISIICSLMLDWVTEMEIGVKIFYL